VLREAVAYVASAGLHMKEYPPDIEDSCRFTEEALVDS
jgi:hypothetical protein